MFKRGVLVFVLAFLLIGFICAEEVEIRFTAKQDTVVNITERCKAFGIPCGADWDCNLTLEDPDRSILVLNKQMTRDETVYNYTLAKSQSSVLGIYENTVCCQNATSGDCNTFYYKITGSGRELRTSDSLVYFLVLLGSVGAFLLALYAAIMIPWRHPRSPAGYISAINYLKHFKLASALIAYLLLIWVFNIFITITNNFLFLDNSFNFFSMMYTILIIGLMPIVMGTVLIIVINLVYDRRIKRFLDRGIKLT